MKLRLASPHLSCVRIVSAMPVWGQSRQDKAWHISCLCKCTENRTCFACMKWKYKKKIQQKFCLKIVAGMRIFGHIFWRMVLHFTDYPSIGIDILNFDNVCWFSENEIEAMRMRIFIHLFDKSNGMYKYFAVNTLLLKC